MRQARVGDTTADRYLWTDLETDHADYGTCGVLEAAWYLTDMDLRDVGHRLEHRYCGIMGPVAPVAPYRWSEFVETMPDVVWHMHHDSGLADAWAAAAQAGEIVQSGTDLGELILASVEAHVPFDGRLFIAGDGVGHFDRLVFDSVAPKLGERLHYRPQGDVSPGVRLMSRGQWGPAEFLRNNAAAEARVRNRYGPVHTGDITDPQTVSADHRAIGDMVRALTAARCILDGEGLTWPS